MTVTIGFFYEREIGWNVLIAMRSDDVMETGLGQDSGSSMVRA